MCRYLDPSEDTASAIRAARGRISDTTSGQWCCYY